MEQGSSGMENLQMVCDSATVGLYSAATSLQVNGNILISPLSIVYASLLVYLGARGKTRSNLDSALHLTRFFGNDSAGLSLAFSDALTQLKVPESDQFGNSSGNGGLFGKKKEKNFEDFQLLLANGIFLEKTFQLDKNYLSNVTRYLRASVISENFLGNPEAARKDINKWAEVRSGGKIQDLVPVGGLDLSTKAVLVNAVYFKANWANQFKISDTRKGNFSLLSGKKISSDFMHLSRALNFAENEFLKFLEIPFSAFETSLLIFLPNKPDGLRQMEKALTPELLRNLSASADDERPVLVSLPKFKVHNSFDLVNLLKKLGVSDLFTNKADLSGMASAGDVQVSAAFHKTFIDVNEKGTEAAAASAVVVATKMAMMQPVPVSPPVIFNADHPFLYAIRHNPTNLIIFIGRVETV